jgi:hypothetical protein
MTFPTVIPTPCLTCKHFSGMKHIPFCKRRIISQVGTRKIHPWCVDEVNNPAQCGPETIHYESLSLEEQTDGPTGRTLPHPSAR